MNVNKAILESLKCGRISSATLLVNMPASKNAFNLIRENKLQGRIGLHLNFQEGKPLTDGIKKFICCDENGIFNYSFREGNHFWRQWNYLKAIQWEIEAQLELFYNELGFYPSHIDSHDHSHTEFFMLIPLSKVLRRFPVMYVRPTRNIGKISIVKRVYKRIYRFFGVLLGIHFVDYFGSIDDLIHSPRLFNKSDVIEIETHCIYDDKGVIRDIYDYYDDVKFNILNKFNLVNYNDIK